MAGKTMWIVFIIYSFPNLSDCTEPSGLLADKRMNMNVLKMFDRFFLIRHKDEFFIRNFKKNLTDDYLTSFYGKEYKMTKKLKKDLSMHAIYLENSVWHTTSITELFTVLYTKYLAANHSMSFINCRVYYTFKDKNEEKATNCEKVAKYLYSIMRIALEKYTNRTEEFLDHILDARGAHPYRDFFYALSRYFTHVQFAMDRKYLDSEKISVSEDEFLKNLLLEEIETSENSKLKLKYYFRNFFFGTPIKNNASLEKKLEEEKKVLNSKELKFLQNKTIKFWEVADKMANAIENRNPLTPRRNFRKTSAGEVIEEMIIKSNFVRIIRKLEIKSLLAQGIKLEPDGISKLKNGSEEEVFQLFVDPGYSLGEQLKFVSLEAEKLNNLPIDINDYAQMGTVLDEGEFSAEAIEKINPREKFLSTSANLQSSSESFRTTHDLSTRSSSQQILDASQIRLNQIKSENIRRYIAERILLEQAKKSSKMDAFRPPSDVSHLKGRMALSGQMKSQEVYADVDHSINSPEKNISDYYDASKSISTSQSDLKQKHKRTHFYSGNVSEQSLQSNSQMISAY